VRAAHPKHPHRPGTRKEAGPRQWPTRPPRPAPSPPRTPVATCYHGRRSALRAHSLSYRALLSWLMSQRGTLPSGILPVMPALTPESVTEKGTTPPPLDLTGTGAWSSSGLRTCDALSGGRCSVTACRALAVRVRGRALFDRAAPRAVAPRWPGSYLCTPAHQPRPGHPPLAKAACGRQPLLGGCVSSSHGVYRRLSESHPGPGRRGPWGAIAARPYCFFLVRRTEVEPPAAWQLARKYSEVL
jgi:hypothetical protein